MKLPVYVPYTLRRLKESAPSIIYYLVLFALYSRSINPSFIRALSGLLNTHPVPNITVRQLLAALAIERSAKGDSSALQSLLKAWIDEQPYAPSPKTRP